MYADPEQAMAAGFRPWKRCRPLDTIVSNHVWVTEIDYVLNQHYAENITLDELAARVHGSKSHLRHVYKAQTGITPQQKLVTIRLSHAEHQLTNSSHSVAQIGRAVGIPNTAYFIKLFKKHYGVSPLQYRLAN